MLGTSLSRRNFLSGLATSGVGLATNNLLPSAVAAQIASQSEPAKPESQAQRDSRARRIRWWQDAKFGMFIHWGLYSVIGHQEWVMESEGIPIPQYEILAKHFTPKPGAAREWARL